MPNLDLSYEERRERNRKLREKIKQSKLNPSGALKDPQIPTKVNSGAVDTTKQDAKSTHNNPELPCADSKLSNSSIQSHHSESDSNKTITKDSGKANPSQPPSTKSS
jgi:hypothetical protein